MEPELFFLILAHPMYKMWIIQVPNTLELWNKQHFEEKKWRVYTMFKIFSTYLNKGWQTRWHLLYYLLLNMFQTLIRPSWGDCDYLLRCVGWPEACWCYVAGLSVGDVVSECRLNHWVARLKSAYTTQQIVAISWRWTY